jgi:hypothetical protein
MFTKKTAAALALSVATALPTLAFAAPSDSSAPAQAKEILRRAQLLAP